MFSVSVALEKQEFITLYNDVVLLSAMLVAPLGLPEHTASIFGKKDFAVNEILPTYRHCEEYIAKRLFTIRGVSDDVIAATMHKLVAEKTDPEISGLFRLGATTLGNAVEAPSVVYLPAESSAAETAALFGRVMAVLKTIGDVLVRKDKLRVRGRLQGCGRSAMFISDVIDAIPVEALSELLAIFRRGDAASAITYDQYIALLDAYDSDAAMVEVLGAWCGEAPRSVRSIDWLRSGVSFVYSPSDFAAKDAGAGHCFCGFLQSDLCSVYRYEEQDKDAAATPGAWGLRAEQLVEVVHMRGDALHALHEVSGGVYGMNLRSNAAAEAGWNMGEVLGVADARADAGGGGDAVSALCTLDNAIGKARAEGGEVVSKTVLAELLADRTVCRYCAGDLDTALADANEALSLDSFNSSARAVRTRLLQNSAMECVGNGLGEEDCELWAAGTETEEEFGYVQNQSAWLTEFPEVKKALEEHFFVGENQTEAKRAELQEIKSLIGSSVASAILYASAKDAMEAFLLGGAADQGLAALAEDSVRNACRKEAKDFFWSTRMGRKSSGGDDVPSTLLYSENGHVQLPLEWETSFRAFFPRPWTVGMYLQSFEPLEISLDLYHPTNCSGMENLQHAASLLRISTPEPGDSSMHDIDEDDTCDKHSEVAQFAHLLPEGDRVRSDDISAYRFLCCLVEALHFTTREMNEAKAALSESMQSTDCAESESEIKFSSLEQKPETSSECGKGLLECMRLLYAHGIGLSAQADAAHAVPLQLPIGVIMSVALDPSSHTDSPIPGVSFRLSSELKQRVKAAKEERNREESSSDDVEEDVSGDEGSEGFSSDGSAESEEDPYTISAPILSRILSVVSSIAHLCGDDVGSHRCLSAAIALSDEVGDERHTHDSRLKMACLLLEMHEFDDAEAYFNTNVPDSPAGSYGSLVTKMHIAELYVHKFDYTTAASSLRPVIRHPVEAYQNVDYIVENSIRNLQQVTLDVHKAGNPTLSLYDREDRIEFSMSDVLARLSEHQESLSATAESMNGLLELRINPTDTQRALQILRNAFKKYPTNAALCNCVGEVLGQAGDAAGAMGEFRKAYVMSPNSPMPLLNAARVYQQLGQSVASEAHIREAMLRDNSLVLAYVDCAQLCLQTARGPAPTAGGEGTPTVDFKAQQAQRAEKHLERATTLCRHISEIADVFATKAIARIHLDILESHGSSC